MKSHGGCCLPIIALFYVLKKNTFQFRMVGIGLDPKLEVANILDVGSLVCLGIDSDCKF